LHSLSHPRALHSFPTRRSSDLEFRTRSVGGRWSPWHRAAPEAEDVPDDATAESRAAGGWRLGNPYWTGESDRIVYRLHGWVTRLDRKSTRLNSSHRTISYAVFC